MALSILARVQLLGICDPEDPLCVYKDTSGTVQYITGNDVTAYYRMVTKLVMPNISDEELKLISTHSICVTPFVLLPEAGKDGAYIKLCLRCLSNCFEIYLRNTTAIAAQHSDALDDVHQRMTDMIRDTIRSTATVISDGEINLRMDDLEDDD